MPKTLQSHLTYCVHLYIDSRAPQDVDDGASDISDTYMCMTDDDSAPPSPGTGCGSCRENLHGTDWKTRLDVADAGGTDVVERGDVDVSGQPSVEQEPTDAPAPASSERRVL